MLILKHVSFNLNRTNIRLYAIKFIYVRKSLVILLYKFKTINKNTNMLNRHYIPKDLKDLQKGLVDLLRGLSALQEGCWAKRRLSPYMPPPSAFRNL